jgi:hypothetical protein
MNRLEDDAHLQSDYNMKRFNMKGKIIPAEAAVARERMQGNKKRDVMFHQTVADEQRQVVLPSLRKGPA